MSTVRRRVRVKNLLGLHARPATALVNLIDGFASTLTILDVNTGQVADARSMISILALGAAQGTELEIISCGKDSEALIHKVEELFLRGFGESDDKHEP